VLCFARQEGKRRGEHNWWVLVAGDPDEGWDTWRRAAAVATATVAASRRHERESARARTRAEREKKRQGERSPLHSRLAWASVSSLGPSVQKRYCDLKVRL
jgi:hypothetical protein